MNVVVGQVGKAHGVRGDVVIRVRTDDPDDRFAPGRVLNTAPAGRGPLTVATSRWHSGRLLVRFDGIDDRSLAEGLAGTTLMTDVEALPELADPDEYYDHELAGLRVELADGTPFGRVVEMSHGAGGDLLVVRADGQGDDTHLIPFVREIVPTVDVAEGRVVIDPPEGLLDL